MDKSGFQRPVELFATCPPSSAAQSDSYIHKGGGSSTLERAVWLQRDPSIYG